MSIAPDQCRGCSRDLTTQDTEPVLGSNGQLFCSTRCRDDNDTWEALAAAHQGGIRL